MKRGARRRLAAMGVALALWFGLAERVGAAPPPLVEQLNEASRCAALMDERVAEKRFDEAFRLGEIARSIREKWLPPNTWAIGDIHQRFGHAYLRVGRYRDAEASLLRALSVGEAIYREQRDVSLFPVLAELGELYERTGEHAKAEAHYRREIALREGEQQGPALLWAARFGLARVALARGSYAEAERVFQEALGYFADYEASAYRLIVAEALEMLGTILRIRGDHPRAEAHLTQALALSMRHDGPAQQLVARVSESLARLAIDEHDPRRAEELLDRALRIRREESGARHPDRARVLMLLGALHLGTGELDRAASELAEALSIDDATLDAQHPDRAEALHQLGLLSLRKGELDRAKALLGEALRARESRLGARHLLVAASLAGLGRVAELRRDLPAAEQAFARALSVREGALGEAHPEVAATLGDLARVALRRGERGAARDALARALAIQDRNAPMILSMGTEEQKLSYLRSTRREADLALSLDALAVDDEVARALSLGTVFRRKGRVLDAMADSFEALRSRADPVDRRLLDELRQVDARLAELLLRGPRWQAVTKNREDIVALTVQRREIEAEVSKRAGELRDRRGPLTLARVQQAIPEGAALVELCIHRPFVVEAEARADDEGFAPPRVAAFVVHPSGPVRRVDLGEVAALDALVAALRPALASPSLDPRAAARALDAAVMEKLTPLLGDARWIYLSPDGALNLVPFGALLDAEGRYRVESMAFTYLTSGADLLAFATTERSREAPLVVASPDFGDLRGHPRPSRSERAGEGASGSIDPAAIRFPPARRDGGGGEAHPVVLPGHARAARRRGQRGRAQEGARPARPAPRDPWLLPASAARWRGQGARGRGAPLAAPAPARRSLAALGARARGRQRARERRRRGRDPHGARGGDGPRSRGHEAGGALGLRDGRGRRAGGRRRARAAASAGDRRRRDAGDEPVEDRRSLHA